MTPAAALYIGSLRHRRFAGRPHSFRYPLFMALLDVDRIAEAMAVSRLTAYNRWNWASFHDADHFGDPRLPLRARLAADAARHGFDLPAGRIQLLTHLRYAGYCFNPVSFFYCYDRDDRLTRVMAEVNNTFGGAHRYWLAPAPPPGGRADSGRFRAAANKALYVSPFVAADMTYGFTLTRPGPRLTVHIDVRDRDGGTALDATLTVVERPWEARAIRRTLLRYPWMTAAVMGHIHWQALRLWWKGVAVVPRPTPRGEMTLDRHVW